MNRKGLFETGIPIDTTIERETPTQVWQTRQTVLPEAVKSLNIKPETSVFLYNTNTKEHIRLTLMPNTMSDQYRPTFHEESNIYGRSTPLYFYTGGSDKRLSFSFTLHEDELHKSTDDVETRRNLRKFLEKLQRFSEPTINIAKQTLVAPEVYLQVGSQFSGKGFIEVGWSYKTPYRNNRYILAEVNLTFTYVLEYAETTPKFTPAGDMVYIGVDEFTFDLTGVDETLTEFIPTYLDYDYLREYSYEDLKLKEQKKVYKVEEDHYAGIMQALMAYIQGPTTGALISYQYDKEGPLANPTSYLEKATGRGTRPIPSNATNIFMYILLELHENMVVAMYPHNSAEVKVKSLRAIQKDLDTIKKAFEASRGKINVIRREYNQTKRMFETLNWVQEMTEETKKLFKDSAKKLESIIQTQLTILDAMLKDGASK